MRKNLFSISNQNTAEDIKNALELLKHEVANQGQIKHQKIFAETPPSFRDIDLPEKIKKCLIEKKIDRDCSVLCPPVEP
jgi:hypothetical protein